MTKTTRTLEKTTPTKTKTTKTTKTAKSYYLLDDKGRVDDILPGSTVEVELAEVSGKDSRLPGSPWVRKNEKLYRVVNFNTIACTGCIDKEKGAFPWWVLLLPCFLLPLLLLCLPREEEERDPYVPLEKAPDPEPEEAPEPEPVAPQPSGVRIDFQEAGGVKTVYMKYKPLGIIHAKRLPIVVDDFKFNSYAFYKGVTQRSTVIRVADTDLDDSMTYDETMKFVGQQMQPLKVWPLRITFATPSGEEHEKSFTHQPLGFEISTSGPYKITKIGQDSEASKLGVEVDYHIVKIGHESVKDHNTFDQVKDFLRSGSILLPPATGGRSMIPSLAPPE